nr:putative ribonuclease H-like domain-containing protein [Tanacetum cinerariifolium]
MWYQAPRAWYETLANYLLSNGFHRGKIDQTLFIKRQNGDILLVQVYVDDIIFGSTKKELCNKFERLMKDSFQMSYMGELTFFLGLQVKQKDDGIFISQDKYVTEVLRKFNFSDVKTASTPVEMEKPLVKDANGVDVDVHLYRSMIGSLMYLTTSRPDIIDSPFELVAYIDSDYAGASLDRKSTTGGCTACLPNTTIFKELAQIGAKTIAWNKFSSTMASAIICMANNQKFNFSKYILNNMVKNLEAGVKFYMFSSFVQVFVNHQLGDMSRHKGIFVNPSLTKKIFANMKRVGTCFSRAITPLFETMMRKKKSRRKQRKAIEVPHTEPQAEERVPTPSNDPLPSEESQEAREKEKSRTSGLKRFYKVGLSARIVSSDEKGLGDQEDASKQGRIAEIDADEDLSLIDETAQAQGRMDEEDLFGVHDLDGDEVFVDVTTGENVEQDTKFAKKEVSTVADEVVTTVESVEGITAATTPQISKDDVTLAQTLIEIKAAKPRARGVIVKEPSEFRTTSSLQSSQLSQAKDKDKGIMIEPEKPLKKKDQIAFDEEVARKLDAQMKAKMEKEERIEREKDEANRAQKDFKGKNFDVIKKMFDKVYKRVNTFMAMDSEGMEGSKKTQAEVTKGSSKRAGDEKEQKSAKKQKLDEKVQAEVADDDTAELKRCLEIVSEDDDDVTIEATPLSSKSPTIVNYKIYKEGKKSYFKIIRADGNSQNYLTFGKMFKNFNREDLEVLRSIVKIIFEKTKPVNDMDNLLFQTLKTMFEHHIEDNI